MDVDVGFTIAEVSGFYSGDAPVDFIFGDRYFHISSGLLGKGALAPLSVRKDRNWIDPIVGMRFRTTSGKWIFSLRGDIGGFGVASGLSWNGAARAGYRLARVASLQAGYRVMGVNYETGQGSSLFEYNMVNTGPGIRFTFHF